MKEFKAYFNYEEIIRKICKIRVKLAKSRNKKHLLHLLTNNPKFNYHSNSNQEKNEFQKYQNDIIKELNNILPPRKQWVKIGEYSRVKKGIGSKKEFLTSNDKNFYSLLKTIKKHRNQNSSEAWFINLNNFVKNIQYKIESTNYSVSKPIIFPKLKDQKKLPPLNSNETNDCRPISMFKLEDSIILSLTNKFLTRTFDKYFKDSSYAFRFRKNDNKKTISHHDCIKEILEYKKNTTASELYVLECDMKNFYDTVNHKIVISKFNALVEKALLDFPYLDFTIPTHIFKSYLNSYCFNINVKNVTTKQYWDSYEIVNGKIPWVDKEINEYYTDLSIERIGVPQGGALSGLIANIFLDEADEKLESFNGIYLRFCDDMIVIHDTLDEIESAKITYVDTLKKLKLFPHPFKPNEELQKNNGNTIDYTPFWDGKSKGPYNWSSKIEKGSFTWIAFVGYQINFNGELRVRKKSFEKEFHKQKQIINEIRKALKKDHRCKKGTPLESAINRLIGMSVGRIALHNFEEVSTDMCWKNGFQELTLNSHTSRQLKSLDRNRSKLYYDLKKEINKLFEDQEDLADEITRELISYNKPFSYYYQVLERNKKDFS